MHGNIRDKVFAGDGWLCTTMPYQGAVKLAGGLQPRLMDFGHYGMFANTSEAPEQFTDSMDVKFRGCLEVGGSGRSDPPGTH
jgi:hypothetical protein